LNEIFTRSALLNVEGLSGAEVDRVRVFLPYCVGHTQHRWDLAPAGDRGHAWLVDIDAAGPATLGGARGVPGGIVRVQRRGSAQAPFGDAMTLSAPLQLDEFIQVLQRVEARMAESMAADTAPVPLTLPGAWPQPPGGGAPRPVQAPGALSLTATYRLKRWPPASVLGTHRYNARLASFLSARHLTPEQLSTLSNVDHPWCVAFLSTLQGLGLLDRKDAAPRPQQGPPAPAPAPRAAPVPAVRSANLLGRIRRRLGIE
jgi:hypothetical protein